MAKKLPPLPKLRTVAREKGKVSRGLRRISVALPPPPLDRMKRDPVHVEASVKQFKEDLAKLGIEKEETDRKIAEMKPQLDRIVAEQIEADRRAKLLTTDEKIFILEAYFDKGVGPTKIAESLGRNPSVIVRFVQKYRSTTKLAKMHIEANAERLAQRVIAKANVTESLEVLDRVDALPKKSRGDEQVGPKFNIFVGMPGTKVAPPVPDQKAIEAAVISKEE